MTTDSVAGGLGLFGSPGSGTISCYFADYPGQGCCIAGGLSLFGSQIIRARDFPFL